eukprot:1324847-Lingulodinium_polyedra.AAC.1
MGIPQSFEGLNLLGSAVAGEYETILGPRSLVAQPAADRLAQARALLTELKGLSQACPERPTCQTA